MAILPRYLGGVDFGVRHVIVNSPKIGKDVGETLEHVNPTKVCREGVKG